MYFDLIATYAIIPGLFFYNLNYRRIRRNAMDVKDRIIVALDVNTLDKAESF